MADWMAGRVEWEYHMWVTTLFSRWSLEAIYYRQLAFCRRVVSPPHAYLGGSNSRAGGELSANSHISTQTDVVSILYYTTLNPPLADISDF